MASLQERSPLRGGGVVCEVVCGGAADGRPTAAACESPMSDCFRSAAGMHKIDGMDRTEPAVHRPALVLGVLSASILLDALDLSITQVALPSIQRDLALTA